MVQPKQDDLVSLTLPAGVFTRSRIGMTQPEAGSGLAGERRDAIGRQWEERKPTGQHQLIGEVAISLRFLF